VWEVGGGGICRDVSVNVRIVQVCAHPSPVRRAPSLLSRPPAGPADQALAVQELVANPGFLFLPTLVGGGGGGGAGWRRSRPAVACTGCVGPWRRYCSRRSWTTGRDPGRRRRGGESGVGGCPLLPVLLPARGYLQRCLLPSPLAVLCRTTFSTALFAYPHLSQARVRPLPAFAVAPSVPRLSLRDTPYTLI
jgi:hypothetical protein